MIINNNQKIKKTIIHGLNSIAQEWLLLGRGDF